MRRASTPNSCIVASRISPPASTSRGSICLPLPRRSREAGGSFQSGRTLRASATRSISSSSSSSSSSSYSSSSSSSSSSYSSSSSSSSSPSSSSSSSSYSPS